MFILAVTEEAKASIGLAGTEPKARVRARFDSNAYDLLGLRVNNHFESFFSQLSV
jgi:hypothetical protein